MRARLLLGCLLLPAAAWAVDEVPTVGSVTENNGLQSNGWVIVKTPSILRVERSQTVLADPRRAIEEYDRLAELEAAPELRAEALRRSADLRLRLAEAAETLDEGELQRALAAYERLLAEYPAHARADRALYQMARAHQLLGQEPQTIAALQALGRSYPQSARLGDALFRAAELLYRDRQYAAAEAEYRRVVALGERTPYLDTAQYKHGWALFQLGRHEEALPVFWGLLERLLPAGAHSDPQAALALLKPERAALAGETLRVASLSLTALGGAPALGAQLARREPRFATLLYAALGSQLLEKQRYSEAAAVYSGFAERQPRHALAPQFQRRAMQVYADAGFGEQVAAAKAAYVTRYAPGAEYWGGRAPPAEVLAALRQDLADLGRHDHAGAQAMSGEGAARRARLLKAAGWYERLLALQAGDAPARTRTRLLRADALLDGGETERAAREYAIAGYEDPQAARAPEAAYAAVQAWEQLARSSSDAAQLAARRESIAASLRLAEVFPQHAQRATVLALAAENLLAAGEHEPAVSVARRVLEGGAAPLVARSAQAVIADARYAQQRYAEAESAYGALLPQLAEGSAERSAATEQLAAAIYRQGEAARSAGDWRAAAAHFQRVGRAAPAARIRPEADYDAAAALMAARDWRAAQAALEGFRTRHPQHRLLPDTDKKLALAYQEDDRLAAAAAVYARIAQRPAEAAELRRDAAWLSASLYDEAQLRTEAARSYESYVGVYPQPLEAAQQARQRLAVLARGDNPRQRQWWQAIVDADRAAGSRTPPPARLIAAQASLDLGRLDALQARALPLAKPIAKSLPLRKAATEKALALLDRAAAYGFAEVTTAATYELAAVYRDLGRALLQSERPVELRGEALEQYQLLLEEQAFPFEEKSIAAHEANLARLGQGVWNGWVQRSTWALAELVPAKYAKRDVRETSYESLR